MRTISRDVVGAFIFSADGKLLLGKAGVYSGMWCIPGGGIEEGETELEALIREAKEETGLDIAGADIERLPKTPTGQSEKVLPETGERVLVNMRFINYKVTLPQNADAAGPTAATDFRDACWVSADELKDMTLSPPAAAVLRMWGHQVG